MKTALKFSFLLFSFTVLTFACNSDKGDKVDAMEAESGAAEVEVGATVYNVNTASSMISWKGNKALNIGDEHSGTVKISDGELAVENGNITAGNFTIDMASIENQDLPDDEKKGKLVGHLKSEDFFSVEEYPTAKFEVTSVEAVANNPEITHNVTGNLTMRGETKQITIPTNVSMADGKITAATSDFTIDRTEWNVMYGSNKLEGIAKDKAISNDLTLKITLNASKPAM